MQIKWNIFVFAEVNGVVVQFCCLQTKQKNKTCKTRNWLFHSRGSNVMGSNRVAVLLLKFIMSYIILMLFRNDNAEWYYKSVCLFQSPIKISIETIGLVLVWALHFPFQKSLFLHCHTALPFKQIFEGALVRLGKYSSGNAQRDVLSLHKCHSTPPPPASFER